MNRNIKLSMELREICLGTEYTVNWIHLSILVSMFVLNFNIINASISACEHWHLYQYTNEVFKETLVIYESINELSDILAVIFIHICPQNRQILTETIYSYLVGGNFASQWYVNARLMKLRKQTDCVILS